MKNLEKMTIESVRFHQAVAVGNKMLNSVSPGKESTLEIDWGIVGVICVGIYVRSSCPKSPSNPTGADIENLVPFDDILSVKLGPKIKEQKEEDNPKNLKVVKQSAA